MSHRPEKELRKIKRPPDSARQAKQVIQRRTIYLLLLFGAATFLAVFAKAYDLTINQGEELKARASRQQTQSTPISASRGAIYDRSGTVLAVSATADTVYLAPRVIQRYAAELDREREAIADFLQFEESTSAIWPWALPADEILQNEELLRKVEKAVSFDSQGSCDTDALYDALDRIVGINPALNEAPAPGPGMSQPGM